MLRVIARLAFPAILLLLTSTGVCEDEASTVRVASISFEPVKFDLASNTKTLESWFRKAAAGGAKIAVAPEGALEGYVVDGIIAEDVAAEKMRDVALTIDAPAIRGFQRLARELRMCLVFGFAERIGDSVYNCAVFIDDAGRICGKQHKMQLAEGYHPSWWFNRLGQQSRAFDTPFGRCGVLICNDRWNPRLAKIPALDGAQLLLIPSFGSTSKRQDEAVLSRGVENGLPVIEANVGVSLIVSDNKIAALERRREGVTFAEISIPPEKAIDVAARDREELAFLAWRETEMSVRCTKRMAELGRVSPSLPSKSRDDVAWYDVRDIGIEGRAWADTETFYDRLPARAKLLVRPPVWHLSQHSAGMCVRFMTNAETIHVRWALRSGDLAMPHMPATGVSGVDLYVRHNAAWHWLATGQPTKQINTARLVYELDKQKREYLLYLPLYNGVTSVELGVQGGATVWQKRPDEAIKPVLFWGTSITQGGCASRPGMVHTAILGRRLERPVINLGFSGNGKLEPEMAELISETDAAVFVIDCLPNLTAALVTERVRPAVEIIRKRRKDTPILLVEDRTYSDSFLVAAHRRTNEANRAALRAAYLSMQADGISELYYLHGDGLLGLDGEDTVDGSHPTDLGFLRQARAFEAALRPILDEQTR